MTSGETERRGATGPRRTVARLAAVQALYEIDITDAPVDGVLTEFLRRRWNLADGIGDDATPAELAEIDGELFTDLVRGTSARRADVDRMIGEALNEDWTVERLEVLIRATLRAGAYELLARADVPARVVISEYVDVARSFFGGSEPGLINGVLDRLAHVLRAAEFQERA